MAGFICLKPLPGQRAAIESFCGAGWAVTANIGSHMDGRVTVAWPLISHAGESDGVHVYFGDRRPILNAMTNNMSPICNVRSHAIALNLNTRIVMRTLYRHPMFRRLIAAVLMLGVA